MINRLFDLYKVCFPEIVREDEKVLKILSFPENHFIVKENDGEISKEFMEYFADPMNWEDLMNMDF